MTSSMKKMALIGLLACYANAGIAVVEQGLKNEQEVGVTARRAVVKKRRSRNLLRGLRAVGAAVALGGAAAYYHHKNKREKPFLIDAFLSGGSLDALKDLVEKGANIDAKSRDGQTLLMLLAEGKSYNSQIADWLLSQGPELELKDIIGSTALGHAVLNNNVEFARKLIADSANVNASVQFRQLKPLLLVAACRKDSQEMVKLLLDSDADCTAVDSRESNFLECCVEEDTYKELAETFMKHSKFLALPYQTRQLMVAQAINSATGDQKAAVKRHLVLLL